MELQVSWALLGLQGFQEAFPALPTFGLPVYPTLFLGAPDPFFCCSRSNKRSCCCKHMELGSGLLTVAGCGLVLAAEPLEGRDQASCVHWEGIC